MRKLRFVTVVGLLLLSISILGAQAQTAQPAAQVPAGMARLSGAVKDSTGGVMVSVDVRVLQGEKVVAQTQTDGEGNFAVNVPPGEYRVEVAAVDFSPFRQTVQASATSAPLAITLTLAALEETRVEVRTAGQDVGVDPESSLTSQTIVGEALLDLPENEEDLATYLQNMAARAGAADGTANIVIDGFTDGRLPSRDQIAEIRIVNNTFSAEGAGEGPRIEIITRTGTGKWQGNFNFTFGDESLNAANALTGRKPSRQTRNYTTNANGPVIKNKLNMGFRIQSNESEGSAQSVRAVGIDGPVNFSLSSPSITRTYGIQNARYSLTPSNTINFSGSVTRNNGENQGVNGFNLMSRASSTKTRNWQVQMSDRATLSNSMVHELRFQASRNNNSNTPISDAMAINVADAFTSGGGSTRSDNHSGRYQLANTLTWQLMGGKLSLRSGGQLDYQQQESNSQQNYNGTYYFSSLHDYCLATSVGGQYFGSKCLETQAIVEQAAANGVAPTFIVQPSFGPARTVEITGIPTQYRRTFGDPAIEVSQVEFSSFIQGDYRLTTRAQLQMGLRYQVQQHLQDYNNFAPTLGLNYQVHNSQNWRSIVRVGGRVTQQTFSMGSWQQLLQSDGQARQFNIDITDPLFDPVNGPPFDPALATSTANSIRQRSDDYRSGYSINTSATWEQGMPRNMSVSVTFQRTRGVHNNRNRNINAPYPGTLPADVLALLNANGTSDCTPGLTPAECLAERDARRVQGQDIVNSMRPYYPITGATGNIFLMEPTGNSLSKSINLNFRSNNRNYFGGRLNLGGNVSYNYSWAYDDNSPVNQYDIAADWGLSNRQHRINSSVQMNLFPNYKWKNLRLQFTPTWNSGRPYSITLGRDENRDSSSNDRPAGIARNTETGPSQFNINMTVGKTFYLRSASTAPRPANNYAEPQGGGGFGGGGFGGGGGGFGGGGGGGNRGNQGSAGTQMTLSANITNVLNTTQYSNYSGVLTSSFFGRPSSSSGERRITVALSFRYQ